MRFMSFLAAVLLGVLLIVAVAALFLSGSHPILTYTFGNAGGGLFQSSQELVFVLGFVVIYLFGLATLLPLVKLPKRENLSKVFLVTLLMFFGYLVIIGFARQGLQSREVFLIEFVVVFLLLCSVYLAIIKFTPGSVYVVGHKSYLEFLQYKQVSWKLIEDGLVEQLAKHDRVAIDVRGLKSIRTKKILSKLVERGITVYDSGELLENLSGRVLLEGVTFDQLTAYEPRNIYVFLKRVIDIILSILFMPIVLALVVGIGLVIKLDSRGPVFFIQTRIGYRGHSFRLVKFRTMYDQEEEKPTYAAKNDRRITRVGRWLRRSRLDEASQLWNVLKGDMSLVGPRPEQEYFVRQYEQDISYYEFRHSVRPGITGWAQIRHGYAEGSVQTKTKLEHDFYYLKNASLWLDFVILASTIVIIIKGSGAR